MFGWIFVQRFWLSSVSSSMVSNTRALVSDVALLMLFHVDVNTRKFDYKCYSIHGHNSQQFFILFTAINHMEIPTKSEIQKNNTNTDFLTFANPVSQSCSIIRRETN